MHRHAPRFRAAALALVLGAVPACQCGTQKGLNKVSSRLDLVVIGVDGAEVNEPVGLTDGVTFSPVRTGSKSTRIIRLKNVGNADLHVYGEPKLKGGSSGFTLADALANGPCEERPDRMTLAVGACATVTVTFAPQSLGPFEDALILDSDDPIGTMEVPLRAVGATSDIDLCVVGGEDGKGTDTCTGPAAPPPVVRFPLSDIGRVSAPRAVRLSNTGELALRVSSIQLKQGDGKEFAVEPSTYSGTIEKGIAVPFTVSFVPAAGGERTATLEVYSDDPDERPAVVKLTAFGDAPQLCPDPLPNLDFGDVEINTTKDLSATFNNCGTRPLDVTALSFSGSSDFTTTPPTTPVTLKGGERVRLTIRYAPKDLGPDDGKIRIDSTDPRTPVGFLNVKGNGVTPPACTLEAAATIVDFGTVAQGFKATRLLTLHNAGKLPCKVTGVSFDAAASAARFFVEAMTPPPFTVAPNGFADLRLGFQPTLTSGSSTGQVLIANTSTTNPIAVTLKGAATAAPECHFTVAPVATLPPPLGRFLNFGYVKVNTDKAMPLSLTNSGSADCVVSSAALSTGTDTQVFKLLGLKIRGQPATFPAKVSPGDVAEVMINFRPNAEKEWSFPLSQGGVEVQTTEKAVGECRGFFGGANPDGCKKATFNAIGAASGIEVVPSTLDFGLTTVGCNSVDQRVTVYNTGKTDLLLQKIYVDPTTAPFKIVQVPATPLTLLAGKSLDVKVRYRPPDASAHVGLLVFESDATNNKSYTVPLKGSGTTSTHQKDLFQQGTEPKTDVLWVIDNSCSMVEEQTNMASNAQTFVNAAKATANDFQIGVVSTDIDGSTKSKSGRKVEPGILVGPPKIITRSTPNAGTEFANNIELGTYGSGEEKGLEAAHLALSSPRIDDASKNLGFLRKDAKLSIIIVSDEEDSSPATVDFYVDFFQRLKGARNSALVSVHAVVGQNPIGCSSRDGAADAGKRYIEAASRTGGLFRSICSSDWGRIANDLGLDAFAAKAQFFLTRSPDPATLVVTVNGTKQVSGTDFDYDATSNSIIFKAAKLPAKGASVVADYDTLCL